MGHGERLLAERRGARARRQRPGHRAGEVEHYLRRHNHIRRV